MIPLPTAFTTDLYFEVHITLDPPGDRLELLKSVVDLYQFRVASLLLMKGGPHTADAFVSCRGTDWVDVRMRVHHCCRALQKAGFVIRRYKVENTLVDSNQASCGDIFGLLG